MKKKVSLLITVFISFTYLLIISNISGESLTGEIITGEVSAQSTNVSIQVIRLAPFLSILNPENKTYLKNESLLLNFTVTDEETVWYNFDNTANTTITSSILFNISQGSHTLYMFANNSENNITLKNVTFTIDSTIFIISYNNFADSNKGDSTDFNVSTYEDIQNLDNIILEETRYGKIQFNEAINLTNDLINNDNLLDLDNNINISQNRIELNSTALPNFDKSATLYLYNLTFDSPRILRDGVVCPSSICTFQSYSGGNLTFDVTEFTVYSAEETPGVPSAPAPSAGAGGGGLSFTIDINEIIISLKQGEIKTKEIKIKNERNTKISFSVFSDMGELVKISEENFELKPKEEKTIFIDFIAKENTVPELYLGNLFIESEGIKKRIAITIEIESKGALFDVRLNIPEKYLKIYPGEELNSEIEIFNIVETGKVNVTIEYSIKNEQNIEIISEEDTLLVDQISFVKIIKIPENIEPGRYILYIRVTHNEKVASASAWFSVKKRFILKSGTLAYIILGILTLVILIILYKIKWRGKLKTEENLLARRRLIAQNKINEYLLARRKLIKKWHKFRTTIIFLVITELIFTIGLL